MTLVVTYDRLTVPQIFRQALSVFQHQPTVFLTLSTMVVLPLMLFGVVISSYTFHSMTDISDAVKKWQDDQTAAMGNPTSESNTQILADLTDVAHAIMNHIGFFATIWVIQIVVFSVLNIAGRGAMIIATAELYVSPDAEPSWLKCFQEGLRRFWSLFCAGVLMSFAFLLFYGVPVLLLFGGYVGVGVVMLLVFPWIVFYGSVRLSLIFPAIVVEGLAAMDGIKRSWELTKNSFCDIFCTLFAAAFMVGIVANIFIKVIVGNDPLAVFRPGGVAITQLLNVVCMPYIAIVTTILYFNVRIVKEGMDQHVLSRDLFAKRYQGVPLLDVEEAEATAHGGVSIPATSTDGSIV